MGVGTRAKQAFNEIKAEIGKEVLLSYPDFNSTFEIHTDASQTQLGAAIMQHGRPIAFYSRKLSIAQSKYTTTERELLSIVETCKEFRNILLGQKIKVYTDHKNLTYKNFNTDRVMRWRLILEEYGLELNYIKGLDNVAADALSRLDIEIKPMKEYAFYLAECFSDLKISTESYPLKYKLIQKGQQADKELLAKFKLAAESPTNNYSLNTFRGGEKPISLICYKDKIVVLKMLQSRIIQWYHKTLCHPGRDRTEKTIRQHFIWNKLSEQVRDECKRCHICQKYKKSATKYGLLPEKVAESNPWEMLCVDLIGTYTIQRKG